MLNPYVLLALLISLGAATFGGYRYGYSRAEDAVSARVAAAQVEAIATANRDVETAAARAVAQAKADASRRMAYQRIQLEGQRDAALKARPECSRDDDSLRLLRASIAAANGQTPAIDKVPDSVHADP